MSYTILARKYRPQVFDDVIGQEMVTRTLKNSIRQGRVANAYMFSGPRGVGKTSIARLLAKTLNCEEKEEAKRPCNKCRSCLEISGGNNIDVLEIDGASNNGVDEIRALRENVKFTPSKGRYKIYIIDEVHMLSTGAFNALLKTLEEPPAHVKFIFATTEPHKVLPTIMSRCQRFDFKRISPREIHHRLAFIAETEKIELEEKAALLIARSADGSLRDALVILDQMVSFSGNKVSSDDVVELLGMVHRDSISGLAGAITANDPGEVARKLDEMINAGKDPIFIAQSLLSYFRDVMVVKAAGGPTQDMALAQEELAEINEQAEALPLDEILYILQNISHSIGLMKGTLFARAPLEIALIRLTRRKYKLSLPELYERISGMDETGDEGAGGSFSAAMDRKPGPRSVGAGAPESPAVSREEGSEDEPDQGFDNSKFHWKALLKYLKSTKMSVFTFLSAGRPLELSAEKIVIGFDKEHEFYVETLETDTNKAILREAVDKVTGASPRIQYEILEADTPDPQRKEETERKKAEAKERMKPVVEQAMDVFGGRVVRDIAEEG
ncbi:MAG: DNA polymerase III subunit gamma/tau [Candidatus Omnitrophica bacterium]|nr:DNA polymerase III subunit gamma/tau [Candidatus Omnitrophota bacterium]